MRIGLNRNFVVSIFIGLLFMCLQSLRAQPISVGAAVSSQDVFRGEFLVLQVQINGSDSPSEPDTSGLTDFQVQNMGGQTRNSESITMDFNGKVNRVVKRGYIFSYRVTPRKIGRVLIPSIAVKVNGKTFQTRPIPIQVREPQETDDFKLHLTLSKDKGYVGEPITLTVIWYLGTEARSPQFSLPLLNDSRFRIYSPELEREPRKKYYRITVGGQEVIARTDKDTLNGKTYMTLSFQVILIPQQAGDVSISNATVAFEALVGYRRRTSPLDDFFSDDFFGMGSRGVYKKKVIPANAITLKVLDLPEGGRPANFVGYVGTYNLASTATPTQANVGEPITLTVTLSGPEYLKDIELPPLKEQLELAKNFKIPEEMAEGKIEGKTKIFTQTIRATNPDIQAIPSIELAYFDTNNEQYRIARSQPIPITIKGTRIVTAQDAEGAALPIVKSELKEWSKGIAHNYEDISVLENQQYGLTTLIRSPVWLCVTLGPAAIYLSLLITTVTIRRTKANPQKRYAKGALGALRKDLKLLDTTDANQSYRHILESFQRYLGKKLRLTSGAITFRDIEETLRIREVDLETLTALESLFSDCEAAHYAGHLSDQATIEEHRTQAISLARSLEGKLK